MQSKNQVIILGISIVEKVEEPSSRTVWLIKQIPPSYFAVAAWTSTYSFLLQCSGCVQSKNGVDLVVVSVFYKSGEDERSNSSAGKDKNSSAFLSYHGCLVF